MSEVDLIKFRACLTEDAFEHLKNCDKAWVSGDYLSVGVWGAVFLEAFLSLLLKKLQVKGANDMDLNGKIQRLRSCSKNPKPEISEVPDEIVKRCDDIRNIRNRLVHDTGMKKSTLKQDAELIRSSIQVILQWYNKVSEPEFVDADGLASGAVEEKGKVFLSTITPHTIEQSVFLHEVKESLAAIGIKLIRAELSAYDKKDPIGKIREIIKECDATLIVGLERSHSYYLKEKEGGEKEFEAFHRKYTSGWLHLEAGISNALEKPVYILCEKGIHSDGIFDRDWNTYVVQELDSLSCDSRQFQNFVVHLQSELQII